MLGVVSALCRDLARKTRQNRKHKKESALQLLYFFMLFGKDDIVNLKQLVGGVRVMRRGRLLKDPRG